jgi:hypothetical protein
MEKTFNISHNGRKTRAAKISPAASGFNPAQYSQLFGSLTIERGLQSALKLTTGEMLHKIAGSDRRHSKANHR